MVKININEETVEELRDIVTAIEHYTAHVEAGTDVEQKRKWAGYRGKFRDALGKLERKYGGKK